jgi:gluconate kinase
MLYRSHANAIGLGIVITDALLSTDRDNLRTNFRFIIFLFLTRQLLVILVDT